MISHPYRDTALTAQTEIAWPPHPVEHLEYNLFICKLDGRIADDECLWLHDQHAEQTGGKKWQDIF